MFSLYNMCKEESRYNQVPHLTQEVTKSQENITHCKEKTRQYDKEKHETQITKMIHKRTVSKKLTGGL